MYWFQYYIFTCTRIVCIMFLLIREEFALYIFVREEFSFTAISRKISYRVTGDYYSSIYISTIRYALNINT